MSDFSAGQVSWDPEAIEQAKSAQRAPLEWASSLSPLGLGAKVPVTFGVNALRRQQILADALRRKSGKEALLESMFMR